LTNKRAKVRATTKNVYKFDFLTHRSSVAIYRCLSLSVSAAITLLIVAAGLSRWALFT